MSITRIRQASIVSHLVRWSGWGAGGRARFEFLLAGGSSAAHRANESRNEEFDHHGASLTKAVQEQGRAGQGRVRRERDREREAVTWAEGEGRPAPFLCSRSPLIVHRPLPLSREATTDGDEGGGRPFQVTSHHRTTPPFSILPGASPHRKSWGHSTPNVQRSGAQRSRRLMLWP